MVDHACLSSELYEVILPVPKLRVTTSITGVYSADEYAVPDECAVPDVKTITIEVYIWVFCLCFLFCIFHIILSL